MVRIRRYSRLAVAIAGALVLSTTLIPAGPAGAFDAWGLCVLCGDAGLANALRNVLLFVPFGAALAFGGVPLRRVLLVGALLSSAIELVQVVIPGRHSNPGDVLFNVSGAGLGAVVPRLVSVWLGEARRAPSAGILVSCLTAAAAILSISGYLLRPSFPVANYAGDWIPDGGHLDSFRGWVLEAELESGQAIPRWPTAQPSTALRDSLAAHVGIRVRARRAPPARWPGPLLRIADDRHRLIFAVSVSGADLFIWQRRHAAGPKLVVPDLRLPNALERIPVGSTFDLAVWSEQGGSCVQVQETRHCGLGYTPGRGWSLLYRPPASERLARIIDLAWLLLLAISVGLVAWSRWRLFAAAGALPACLYAIAAATGLLPPPAREVLAVVIGCVAGGTIARLVRGRRANVALPSGPTVGQKMV